MQKNYIKTGRGRRDVGLSQNFDRVFFLNCRDRRPRRSKVVSVTAAPYLNGHPERSVEILRKASSLMYDRHGVEPFFDRVRRKKANKQLACAVRDLQKS